MGLFNRDIIKDSVSEISLCRDYPEYWIMKYLLVAPKKVVGNFKEQFDRYGHIDEEAVKRYFKYFNISC